MQFKNFLNDKISDRFILNKISWKFRYPDICGFATRQHQSLLFWNKSEHKKEVSVVFCL